MKFISSILLLVQATFIILKVIAYSVFGSLSWLQIFVPTFIYLGLFLFVLASAILLAIWGEKQSRNNLINQLKYPARKSGFERRLEEAQRQAEAARRK
jgi:hypothetical protein